MTKSPVSYEKERITVNNNETTENENGNLKF
jgi:hypothetical protein